MSGLGMQIGHLREEQRRVMRPVALAFRRAYRAGAGYHRAVDAAMAEFHRLVPAAPVGELECSGFVNEIIAAAISANTKWFWEGPDA
jgi:hypothetical protein